MNAEIDLLIQFWQLAHTKPPVRLLNIYKGLPISNDARIIAVEADTVRVVSSRHQIACLYLARETYLQTDRLPGSLRAQVVGLNAEGQEATLAGFQVVRGSIGLRENIRVTPDPALPAMIQMRNAISPIQVQVADISSGGLGLYLDRGLFHPRIYTPGGEIQVSFTLARPNPGAQRSVQPQAVSSDLTRRFSRENLRGLPGGGEDALPARTGTLPATGGDTRVNVRGQIKNIRPELHHNRYRIGVRLIVDDATRAAITQYVSQRQAEVIREINQISEALHRFSR